jgi:hypothetical protein
MKMEIEFEFEMNDWMEFNKDYLSNSKQYKSVKLIAQLILPVIFSAIIFLKDLSSVVGPTKLALLSLILLAWILYIPRFLDKRVLYRTKKMLEDGDNSGILGRHQLIISDEGILHIEPESEHNIKWNGFKKIVETDEYYFLYNTAVSALIIPKKKVHELEKLSGLMKKNFI